VPRCEQGGRKFERDIERHRALYGRRNLRFVRNNEVLYWRFLAHLQDRGYQPATVQRYYGQLRTFLRWLAGRSLRRTRREQVEQFLLWFKEHRIRTPYTLRYLRETLAVFFGFVMSHAAMRRNPAAGLRIRTHYPQPERPELFSPEETLLLVGRPLEERQRLRPEDRPNERSYRRILYRLMAEHLMLKLMFSTGLRPCEITNAALGDLDVPGLRLRVRNKGTQRCIVEDRHVFLSARTAMQLQELLAMSQALHGPRSPGRLFVCHRGGDTLGPGYVNRVVKYWARRCGIARSVYAYMCRYTYCTRLVENGVDPYSLKRLMGHKQAATSLRHYLKLTPSELRKQWRQYNPVGERGAG
jgi:site-specific recombinase XerD